MKGLSPEQLVAKYNDIQDASQKEVLAGLEAIDWHSLKHAYGQASDVPALLYALLSEDEYDRAFAFSLLSETIQHQGSVYDASAYAVPFLFQMLQSPITPDKASVACLLSSLVHGTPGTNKEPKFQWVNATRKAVEKGLHLLYPFLEYPDPEVRFFIAIALPFYPAHSQEIIPLLEKALKSESDKFTKAAIQEAIDKLASESSASELNRP
jgi:HEAT repeat protein